MVIYMNILGIVDTFRLQRVHTVHYCESEGIEFIPIDSFENEMINLDYMETMMNINMRR